MSATRPIPLDTPFTAETSGVIVRVVPTFLNGESSPAQRRFMWAYTVEVENGRPAAIILRRRSWEIIDSTGLRDLVEGEGVIGRQPEIAPGDAFRYTSGAPLSRPSGIMRGRYLMQDQGEEKFLFSVTIPTFSLDSPYEDALPS